MGLLIYIDRGPMKQHELLAGWNTGMEKWRDKWEQKRGGGKEKWTSPLLHQHPSEYWESTKHWLFQSLPLVLSLTINGSAWDVCPFSSHTWSRTYEHRMSGHFRLCASSLKQQNCPIIAVQHVNDVPRQGPAICGRYLNTVRVHVLNTRHYCYIIFK